MKVIAFIAALACCGCGTFMAGMGDGPPLHDHWRGVRADAQEISHPREAVAPVLAVIDTPFSGIADLILWQQQKD